MADNNTENKTDFEVDFNSDAIDNSNVSDIALDEYINLFLEFFETAYKKEIEYLAGNYPHEKSLNIDFKRLEAFDLNLAESLIDNPYLMIDAATNAISKVDVGVLESEGGKFAPRIRFFNLPKEYLVDIRDVGSDNLAKFISVEGTIRQITEILEKMTVAHFICRRCGKAQNIMQKGQLLVRPTICECKHHDFDIDLENSKFIDYQKIQIQEPLDKLKGSEQASHIDIFLSEDLVNRCSPGDKIIICGVVKLRPPKGDTNIYSKYLVANHLEKTESEFEELKITPEEETEIRELSKKENIYELLSSSIAPHIHGNQVIKEAITMQLFGGVKKEFAKQSLKGNINILLVGDPSTGKSQIIKYVDNIAPKSIYVAGKTSSGAGLTVSAVKDEFGEGGWTLKAGAIVLASGGIAIIDEFDKLTSEDSSALHEAMAQSTVSVSKAGLYSKFKADTSVLAAANPKFSRFDKYKNPLEQIDLPFSLISRFDLCFIIKDVLDRGVDLEMGRHILETHELAEKFVRASELDKGEVDRIQKQILPPIDPDIFKKYVAYARQHVKPVLQKEASDKILNFYIELRDLGRSSGSYSATPRQLEGLIRLAEASARVKLRGSIEEEDSERAIRIYKTSLEQTAMDLQTGKIDIDILTTGQSQSERSLLKKVLSAIKDLGGVENSPIAISDLVNYAEAEKIPKDKLQEIISKLKKMGEIYEPKNGLLKPTDADLFK
ncbi:MAG: minichromosome maintenance protein MCM [archaeon]